ncbi:MAG TPA: hypothetical protein VFD43_00310, partial [Planctomycetota bacterium]|nr:hypothetical protein [Planctomycetota bacterium]
MGDRASRLARWALAALGAAAACAAPEPPAPDLPLAVIEPSLRLELVAESPGPARVVWARVLIEGADGGPLIVRPVAAAGGKPALLELRVRWRD